ncbi:Uncharacterised protein [Actinobaculum suis]|uniref:Uncharacterized protein n=1 Tax=Actinobaculum suis TaxID=1657 RepID=A0A7Z8Y7T6_9ACTO|nr:hypothetical protein [Actinobaculum suis]VDG75281.1 Uncharacterised protein [Actinobaculum suis]
MEEKVVPVTEKTEFIPSGEKPIESGEKPIGEPKKPYEPVDPIGEPEGDPTGDPIGDPAPAEVIEPVLYPGAPEGATVYAPGWASTEGVEVPEPSKEEAKFLDELPPNLAILSAPGLERVRQAVMNEDKRREGLAERKAREAITRAEQASAHATPETAPYWLDGGFYPKGGLVRCDGRLWRCLIEGAPWRPGGTGWEMIG